MLLLKLGASHDEINRPDRRVHDKAGIPTTLRPAQPDTPASDKKTRATHRKPGKRIPGALREGRQDREPHHAHQQCEQNMDEVPPAGAATRLTLINRLRLACFHGLEGKGVRLDLTSRMKAQTRISWL